MKLNILKSFIKKREVRKNLNYLEKQYKGKEKVVTKINEIEKNIHTPKIDISPNEFIIEHTIGGVNILSNNYVVISRKTAYRGFHIFNIIRTGEKTISDLHQLKKAITFVKKYCKQNKITEININTWIFETYPEFGKLLEFKSTDKKSLLLYKKSLESKNIKKVIYFDEVNKEIKYIPIKGKGIQTINVNELADFPNFVCKVK